MTAVSIVIRCRNEARHLPRVLASIAAQQLDAAIEVLAVDSGSTDDTLDVLARHDVRVAHIAPERFSYGHSLNEGVRLATGEIVVFLSAHCQPCESSWLASLLLPFNDPTVAGTFGRQLPERGTNPIESVTLARLFPATGAASVRFSNANGAARRPFLLAHPFDEAAPIGEDHLWAIGLPDEAQLRYVPRATVTHPHPMGYDHWRRRFYLDGLAASYARHRLHATMPWGPTTATGRLRTAARVVRQSFREGRPGALLHLPGYLLARTLAYSHGVRDGERRYAPTPERTP